MRDFWWKRVAGPCEVIRKTVAALRGEKSVVLQVPQDLPWRHEMRNILREELQSTLGTEDLSIDFLDAENELTEKYEPGKYLIDRFALHDVALHYRPGMATVQDYLLKKKVLHNKIVWIKGIDAEDSRVWMQFCSGWHASSPSEGLFVIEDRCGEVRIPPNLVTIDYSDYVDEYSAQLFNGFALNSPKFDVYTVARKRYVASLMTSLCETDVEVAYALIEEHDLMSEDPLKAIRAVAKSDMFESRGCGSTKHILGLIRGGNEFEIRERIWATQLEILFPMIERERLRIVEKLNEDISYLIAEGRIEQHGDEVTSPEDIELGSLVHLMGSRDSNGKRAIDVTDKGLRDRIFLLWKCRNHLAHHECCDMDEVSQLLDC